MVTKRALVDAIEHGCYELLALGNDCKLTKDDVACFDRDVTISYGEFGEKVPDPLVAIIGKLYVLAAMSCGIQVVVRRTL